MGDRSYCQINKKRGRRSGNRKIREITTPSKNNAKKGGNYGKKKRNPFLTEHVHFLRLKEHVFLQHQRNMIFLVLIIKERYIVPHWLISCAFGTAAEKRMSSFRVAHFAVVATFTLRQLLHRCTPFYIGPFFLCSTETDFY